MKRALALSLSLIALALPTTQAAFPDVPDTHKHHTAITYLSEKDIISGYSEDSFKPDLFVNRAEALKMILGSRYASDPSLTKPVINSGFRDVPATEWFAPYTAFAKNQAIISGYTDGSFRGGDMISFAEALKIALRAYQVTPETLFAPEDLSKTYGEKAKEWYIPYVHFSLSKKLGVSMLPAAYITRGEIAELIYRLRLISQFDLESFDEDKSSAYQALEQELEPVSALFTTTTSSTGERQSALKNDLVHDMLPTHTSPLLQGNAPLLTTPFVLSTQVFEQKDRFLEIVNMAMMELDLIHVLLQKYDNLPDMELLQTSHASIKNELSTLKNQFIQIEEEPSSEERKTLLRSLWNNVRAIPVLYAQTSQNILADTLARVNLLSTLTALADQPEFDAINTMFEEAQKLSSEAKTLVETMQSPEGGDTFVLMADFVSIIEQIHKLLENLDSKYIDLMQ